MTNTPALQPGQFEHTLFTYGVPTGCLMLRKTTAKKWGEANIGKEWILPGQLVRILSVRLEDDPAYPGVRDRVIAVCEVVSSLEAVKPRPYAPEMEYK